jgi:actin-related protein
MCRDVALVLWAVVMVGFPSGTAVKINKYLIARKQFTEKEKQSIARKKRLPQRNSLHKETSSYHKETVYTKKQAVTIQKQFTQRNKQLPQRNKQLPQIKCLYTLHSAYSTYGASDLKILGLFNDNISTADIV